MQGYVTEQDSSSLKILHKHDKYGHLSNHNKQNKYKHSIIRTSLHKNTKQTYVQSLISYKQRSGSVRVVFKYGFGE